MKDLTSRLEGFQDSIFGKMAKLALEHQAINLSQGFPDFDGEQWLKEMVFEKMNQGLNQYAPFPGSLKLRESVASYYQRFYRLTYNPADEISITVGATEAIYLGIHAVVSPGDEVIVFEPFYDSYVASIRLAGGVPIPISLKAPHFEIDFSELASKITKKTKMVIFNNPHNPTGRVFKEENLKELSHIIVKNDLYLMSDEVYEFLTYDGLTHIPSATIEGLKERTLTISSAGKTFGVTGWKIGWLCAPENITKNVRMLHQYIAFSVATPFQEGVAEALYRLEDYIPGFKALYQSKRDLFYQGMTDLGLELPKTEGTYFMMVPTDKLTSKNDVDYSLELIQSYKVAGVPPSAFYLESKDGQKYVRFCFAKKEETLKEAIKNLQGLKS